MAEHQMNSPQDSKTRTKDTKVQPIGSMVQIHQIAEGTSTRHESLHEGLMTSTVSTSTGAIPKASRTKIPRPSLCDAEVNRSSSMIKTKYDDNLNPLKERKKWYRPPLVGQASGDIMKSVVLAGIGETSQVVHDTNLDEAPVVCEPAERDLDVNYSRSYQGSDIYSARGVQTDYKEIENNESLRTLSPTSSAASGRPLEWDSGADVGYHFQHNREEIPKTLSSLERIALSLLRTEPEGSGNKQTPVPQGLSPLTPFLITNREVQSLQNSIHPVMQSTPKNPSDFMPFVPPLNLDGLLSERDKMQKKYKSLDNLTTGDNLVKHHRSSSRSSISKKTSKTLPPTKSASSSSVATVVSKQVSHPQSNSESSGTDTSEKANSNKLIKNLNSGVALLHKLMSQAKNQDEQQFLLQHIITQLTSVNNCAEEPVYPHQQSHQSKNINELNRHVDVESQTSGGAHGDREEGSEEGGWELPFQMKNQSQDHYRTERTDAMPLGSKLMQDKQHQELDQDQHLSSQQPLRSPHRDGVSATSSQRSHKSGSSERSQQVSSCLSQQGSASEQASWSSGRGNAWQDTQIPSSQRHNSKIGADEPSFLSFLESQAEQERLNRAIWISEMIEQLKSRKRFLAKEHASRGKKKLEGDGRSRSGSESWSQPLSTSHRSQLPRSQSSSSSSSKPVGKNVAPAPDPTSSEPGVSAAHQERRYQEATKPRFPETVPRSSSERSGRSAKPVRSQGTQYEENFKAPIASKRPTEYMKNPVDTVHQYSITGTKSSKLSTKKSTHQVIESSKSSNSSLQSVNGSQLNEFFNYENLSVESLSINSFEPDDVQRELTIINYTSKLDDYQIPITSDVAQHLKSKSKSKYQQKPKSKKMDHMPSVVSAPIVNRQYHSERNNTQATVDGGGNLKENTKPAATSKPTKLFFEVPFDDKAPSNHLQRTDGTLSLQESLLRRHPQFVRHADKRRSCMASMAERRQVRSQLRRERLREGTTADTHLDPLPPHPLAEQRLFRQKELRHRTRQKVKKLAEVQAKQAEQRRQEEYRTNRTMASIFRRKLQRRVLQHKVDLSNSVSVISSD